MDTEPVNQSELLQSHAQEVSPHDRVSQAMVNLKTAGDKGTSWFFYIAIFSLINTAVVHMDGDRQFMIGLAITLFMDAVASQIGKDNPQLATAAIAVSIGFSVLISGLSILFGWLARKRYTWAFVTGMTLYLLDGMIFLLMGLLLGLMIGYLSAAFHAYVLYGMFKGIRAYQQLHRLEVAVAQSKIDDRADLGLSPEPRFEPT